MKITTGQLRQIIREEISRLDEQGCGDREEGCVKKSNGSDPDTYGPKGTWYILNNKKGGVFRKGFDTEQSAKDSLEAMHAGK